MNVITAYLETMFGAYPQTARLLEAKTELHSMMEDAYHGYLAKGMSENEAVGRVITEFGNLDELAPQLGISAEITPAGQSAPAAGRAVSAFPPLALDEAQAYAETRQRTEPKLALAVAMFILSPAVLISLTTLASGGVIALGESVASAIGLGVLLLLVVGGVLILVGREQQLKPYRRIVAGQFDRVPSVDRWANELAAGASSKRTTGLQISIVLWILAAVPVISMALLAPAAAQNGWMGLALATTLAMVAAGVVLFIRVNTPSSIAETLTKTSSSGYDESEDSIVGVIAAFYWPITVALFLGYSFLTGDWGRSWIIWPVAAVLFGAIAGGINALQRYRATRQS